MAGQPGIPANFVVQTANQQNLVSWDLSTGATSYVVQRSLDNVSYVTIATVSGSPLATSYLDTAVIVGTQYFYQVAAVNVSGSSPFTVPQSVVPAMTGEMSLGAIRLASQQTADRVNSNFVTKQEWNSFINLAMYELYDLLITVYEDYFIARPIQFNADGSTYLFPLPNGTISFTDGVNGVGTIVAPPFYKLLGVDLALNNAANAWVTVNKFNFIDRNRFVYPNTASTIYGVFNLQYRIIGNQIEFIPTPAGGQRLRMWYIPRLNELLQDTDITTTGISGWLRYAIVRAAIYALNKEESDTTVLQNELIFLKQRIEESAANRDAGQPDTISDTNQGNWANGWYGGRNGAIGGFGLAPMGLAYNLTNHHLANSIFASQPLLGYLFAAVATSYFIYNNRSQLGCRVLFSRVSDFTSHGSSVLFSHILKIIGLSSEEEMIRISARRIVTSVTNAHTFCYRTYKKLIGYARSYVPFGFYRKSRSAILISTSRPSPAFSVIFNDMSHESIIDQSHNVTLACSLQGVK